MIIGHGETYYCAEAVQSMIHDWMEGAFLGMMRWQLKPTAFLYERAANIYEGTELRAISAIDLALWDILGQVCNKPIHRLMGARTRPDTRLQQLWQPKVWTKL